MNYLMKNMKKHKRMIFRLGSSTTDFDSYCIDNDCKIFLSLYHY